MALFFRNVIIIASLCQFCILEGAAALSLRRANGPSCESILTLGKNTIPGGPQQRRNQDREKLESTLQNNSFEVGRGLEQTDFLLNGELIPLLQKLNSNDHWANIGAGKARTEYDYFKSPGFTEKARVTSVSVARPESKTLDMMERRWGHDRYQYLEEPAEEASVKEFGGKLALVTDVLGASQYAASIDAVLKNLAQLTRVGGDILVHVSTRFDGETDIGGGIKKHVKYESIKIVDEKNKNVGLLDWLRTFKGLDLVSYKIWNPDGDPTKGENIFFHLKKTSAAFAVTPLTLVAPPKAALIPPATYVPERFYVMGKLRRR